jgi:hypothetical protein
MTAAYVTHGRKYHLDPACPRMINGEDLHDCEGDDGWGGFTSGTYRREDPSPEYAAARGKLPCLGCVPVGERVYPPLYGQAFGHEPWGPYDGVLICARCYTTATRCSVDAFEVPHRTRAREVVPWPCTSAIVLGLVDREETTP